MDIKSKGFKGIVRYLELKGYDILDKDFDGFIIALNYDGIHFIDALVISDIKEAKLQVNKSNKSRKEFEHAMLKWFASHDEHVDIEACADICNLIVLGSDRGFIKHQINVQELM